MPVRPSVHLIAKLAIGFYLLTATVLLAQKPLGTDVSGYQPANINWALCKSNGVQFAYVKATESTGYVNPNMTSQIAGANAQGIPVGLYHFARPSSNPNITGANSADSEAQYFISKASAYLKTGGNYLIPMLDWEDPYVTNVSSTVLNQTTMSQWVNEWCYYVSNYAHSQGITMKCMVYSGTWYCAPGSSYRGGLNSTVTQWPNAMSGYPSNPNPQTGAPSTSPWTTFTVWQYADTNWSGGDADVFNGTTNQLKQTLVIGGGLITTQPSNRYAERGSSLTMRVGLSSTNGATYQWRFNGTAISGGTKSTLTLTNIQASSAGSYSVVVGGTPGTATSSDAVLTVSPPYGNVFADNFDTNSSASWTVNTSTTDNRATFAYDYSVIGVPAAPNSGGTTKGLRMEANLSGGVAAALSASPKNQSFTGDYRLHFDMWINVNGPLQGPSTGGGTGSTEGITAGVGTAGNRVEWNSTSSTADGVWFFVDNDGDVADSSYTTMGDFGAYINKTMAAPGNNAYAAGTQATANQTTDVYYQNVFPGGQAAPAFQQSNYAQETGTLAPGTVGLGWHDVIVDKIGANVIWYIDGLKIATLSAASATGTNIFVGYWDPYASVSDSTNLSFGLVDNLRVEVPAVAPTITGQPASQTVVQASNTTMNVTATGTPTPNFQWRFNGTSIANATGSSFTIFNTQATNAGSYSVIVSNAAGAVTSAVATVRVLLPPTLTSQPASQTVNVGANASLLFTCTGTQPLTFQWTKDGVLVPGVTSDRLDFTNIQLSDAATYVGTVTNSAGSSSTTNIVLTVVQMQTAVSGFAADGSFQMTISGAPGPGYSIDASTNLVDWFNVAVLTNTNGTVQFTDSNSTNYPQLFYRVSAPSN